MTNDEIRRKTEIRMRNGRSHTRASFDIWASDFFRHLSFVIRQSTGVVFAFFVLAEGVVAQPSASADYPSVTAPPEAFFELVSERDRDVARQFYKKYIDVKGMPVVAAGEVADLALQRAHSIVTHLLAGRPDVIEAMVKDHMYLILIGKDQVYTGELRIGQERL
jgi:hypothetical protein